MLRCSECSCFVPARAKACPECDFAVSTIWRAVKGIAMVGASAATAMTLMACYGSPYDEYECVDADSDGYCPSEGDCDDTNFEIRPGAIDEAGDGIDQNCDGADGVVTRDSGPMDDGSIDSGM
ncbi:MAG: hypothetical protein ACI9KE_003840 [Polyangiales bacterium]|jgi:hypothetical protein